MNADSVHLATPADSEFIAQLLLEAFAEIKSVYTHGGFDATVLDPARIAARMQEGPVWMVRVDDRIAGTVAAVIKPTGLYMRGMAVHPDFRGKRIGNQLLDAIEHYAHEHHCARIFLSTAPYLHSAIRLYEKRGFVRIDDPPYTLFGTPLFSMEKKLL